MGNLLAVAYVFPVKTAVAAGVEPAEGLASYSELAMALPAEVRAWLAGPMAEGLSLIKNPTTGKPFELSEPPSAATLCEAIVTAHTGWIKNEAERIERNAQQGREQDARIETAILAALAGAPGSLFRDDDLCPLAQSLYHLWPGLDSRDPSSALTSDPRIVEAYRAAAPWREQEMTRRAEEVMRKPAENCVYHNGDSWGWHWSNAVPTYLQDRPELLAWRERCVAELEGRKAAEAARRQAAEDETRAWVVANGEVEELPDNLIRAAKEGRSVLAALSQHVEGVSTDVILQIALDVYPEAWLASQTYDTQARNDVPSSWWYAVHDALEAKVDEIAREGCAVPGATVKIGGFERFDVSSGRVEWRTGVEVSITHPWLFEGNDFGTYVITEPKNTDEE